MARAAPLGCTPPPPWLCIWGDPRSAATLCLLPQPSGFEGSGSRRLAPDDVVDVEHLRLAWLDPDIGQHGHQTLAKRLKLLPRVIDLANAKVALCAEADVVIHPVRGKVT